MARRSEKKKFAPPIVNLICFGCNQHGHRKKDCHNATRQQKSSPGRSVTTASTTRISRPDRRRNVINDTQRPPLLETNRKKTTRLRSADATATEREQLPATANATNRTRSTTNVMMNKIAAAQPPPLDLDNNAEPTEATAGSPATTLPAAVIPPARQSDTAELMSTAVQITARLLATAAVTTAQKETMLQSLAHRLQPLLLSVPSSRDTATMTEAAIQQLLPPPTDTKDCSLVDQRGSSLLPQANEDGKVYATAVKHLNPDDNPEEDETDDDCDSCRLTDLEEYRAKVVGSPLEPSLRRTSVRARTHDTGVRDGHARTRRTGVCVL
jgi:hypothetical protein